MYAALVETAGYVPVPLAADDYIELLPAVWRAVNAYGVKIRHRTYDCKALNPCRRQHSGVNARKGLWEVHYDPYDVTRVWVRNHHDSGWIQVPWTHLRTGPAPFGEQAWDHARQMLARRGPGSSHRGRDRPDRGRTAGHSRTRTRTRQGRQARPEGGRAGQGGIFRQACPAGAATAARAGMGQRR